MIVLWIILGVIVAFFLFWSLIIGISYSKIACAWAWQPKDESPSKEHNDEAQNSRPRKQTK